MLSMSTPVQKTVKVQLVSTIRHPNVQEETINIKTKGILTLRGEQNYLVYEESQNEKTIRTTVKLSGQNALILRSGGVKMRLPLERGEFQTGSYETQYGTMIITTNTKHLHFEVGRFQVKYELIINEEVAGTYTLELTYTEAE